MASHILSKSTFMTGVQCKKRMYLHKNCKRLGIKRDVERSQSGFKYGLKNSIKNSESRNGLIKYKGTGFVYLGLESTSTFGTTYAWVDVVATKMETRYVRIKKKPLESTSYWLEERYLNPEIRQIK